MIFTLDTEQMLKIAQWKKEHECSGRYAGAIGGSFEYSFTPTGLGNICKCTCLCGKSIDVTDFENW